MGWTAEVSKGIENNIRILYLTYRNNVDNRVIVDRFDIQDSMNDDLIRQRAKDRIAWLEGQDSANIVITNGVIDLVKEEKKTVEIEISPIPPLTLVEQFQSNFQRLQAYNRLIAAGVLDKDDIGYQTLLLEVRTTFSVEFVGNI